MQHTSLAGAKIAHFEEHFGEPHGMFACQASVPLILSTDLLYKMWLNFNSYNIDGHTKKIPHWAVSDLVLSGLCQPVGYQLYKLEPTIRIRLQQLLLQRLGVTRQIQLAGFLQQFAEKYYGGSEKNIQEIHLLTAASILDPAKMEKQLSNQLQEKIDSGKTDVVNLLSLYYNLAGETTEEAGGESYINLVAEDDPSVPGYLNVVLPDFLQAKVRERPLKPSLESEIKPALKTITIFLASSSELKDERNEFRLFIAGLNDKLVSRHVYLKIIQWEMALDAISDTSLQDEYNKAITKADIAVCLFFTKIGKYSEEEFNTAYESFKVSGKPRIWTYFRDAPITIDSITKEISTLLSFKRQLRESGHYFSEYKNTGDLYYKFRSQLDIVIPELILSPQENKEESFSEEKKDYKYDIYLSYSNDSGEIQEKTYAFLEHLKTVLKDHELKSIVFVDRSEIPPGTSVRDITKWINEALVHSKVLIALVTPKYFGSENRLLELKYFLKRSESTQTQLIFPIGLSKGDDLNNSLLQSLQHFDFSGFDFRSASMKKSVDYPFFYKLMQSLAQHVNSSLSRVPAFDPEWEVPGEGELTENLSQDANAINIKIYLSSTCRFPRDEVTNIEPSLVPGYRISFLEPTETISFTDISPEDMSSEAVKDCDILLLILCNRYGYIPPQAGADNSGVKSLIELNYDTANRLNKNILVFIEEASGMQSLTKTNDQEDLAANMQKLDTFRSKLYDQHLLQTFASLEDLKPKISQSLLYLLRREKSSNTKKKSSFEIFIVCLSYASENRSFATRLKNDLAERFPLICVYEYYNIPAGVFWLKEINTWILNSDFFIYLSTESYSESEVCLEEIQRAKVLEDQNNRPKIIPIKIDDSRFESLTPLVQACDFSQNYQAAFEEMVAWMLRLKSEKEDDSYKGAKKIYVIYDSATFLFYSRVKGFLDSAGFLIANSKEQTDYESLSNDELVQLRESELILILLSSLSVISKSSSNVIEHARQEGKRVQLILDGKVDLPDQLLTYPAITSANNFLESMAFFAKKYSDLLPGGSETGSQTIPAFYNKEQLAQFILTSKDVSAVETINDFLLIFSTSNQQTWLIFTNENVYCVLDDLAKRGTTKLIRWKEKLKDVKNTAYVEFTDREDRGLITLGKPGEIAYDEFGNINDTIPITSGRQKTWFYSKKLFEEPESIVNEINECIARSIGEETSN